MKWKKLALALSKEFLSQVLLAVGILLFFTFYFGITLSSLGPSFTFGLFLLPVTLGTANTFGLYLIPSYLLTQRYWWFGLYTIYAIVISIFFIVLSSFYGLIWFNSVDSLDPDLLITKNLYLIIIGVYMVVLVVSLFAVYRGSYQVQLKNRALQYELLNGQLELKKEELSYLKMQIHPHFLFNTLNTIYGSAIAKSKETPELILKLSNLLDYILYQTPKHQVSLQDEIDHLQDYIELEKMRYGESLQVKTSFPSTAEGILIPPMILLPFLENSFKHGSKKKNAFIDLEISLIDDKITFLLTNSCEQIELPLTNPSSGIGLPNIKKRLELLYPEAHELYINRGEKSFEVRLELLTKIK